MTQQLPTWVEVETAKTRRKPSWRCHAPGCERVTPISGDVNKCPACGGPKYGKPTPKNMPRRKGALPPKPEPLRFHVRVELAGSIDFVLEGRDAIELRELLNSSPNVDDVIEYLDPWSSGADLKQTVEIREAPARWGGLDLQIVEATGGIYHLGGRS